MIRKTLTFKYWNDDRVCLATDPEKKLRIVTGVTIRPSGKLYELACGESTTWHQDVEIEPVKDSNIKIKGFSGV